MMSVAEKSTESSVRPSAEADAPLSFKSNQRVAARNFLTFLVFILGFSPLALTAPSTLETTPIADVVSRDLPNFHVVHSYFYRGAAPSFAGMEQLKSLGVKTIIDLRRTPIMIDAERAYVNKLGIEYVSLPMGDWIPSAEKQELFLSIMNRASVDPTKGPVFLHCSHGSDRTGFLTALWRVKHDHWTMAQALVEMLQRGFFVHKFEPNPAARIDH
jgi:hypothetical protein